MKIFVDVTPMIRNKTGVGYYTERLVVSLAKKAPRDTEIVGFYYNFLGRSSASHLPKASNLRYTKQSLIPSKLVYQLRRWGIEFPVELFTLERADFVLYPNFLDHPSIFKTPSAPVIHDLTFVDLPQYVAPKLRNDLTRFVPKAMGRAAFVITVSDFSKQKITERYGVPSEKILVTHIPALPVVPMTQQQRAKHLKVLGITKPFLLFVGTIDPRKNISGLVDAYTELPEALRKKFSLVIAGRIERGAQAEVARIKQAKQQGYDVLHLGYITDEEKDAIYQSADLFVSASKYEGFGMPLVEAMNYGIPCATSRIPVFTEIGGKAAVYFDADDPSDAAKVISKLLQHPSRAAKLAAAGRKHAASFSWDTIAGSVLKQIQKSLDSRT